MAMNKIPTSDKDPGLKTITSPDKTGYEPSADMPDTSSDPEPSTLPFSEDNIDNDSSESSIFDSRSPQSSGTTTNPPRGEELDRTLRHIGLREFGKGLDRAAKAVFPNNKRSRYSQIHVLLISWETQDPKLPVQLEIGNLRELLDGIYHYNIEEFQIPDHASHAEVSKKINAFVEVGNNSCNDLKIVYYAGHSRLSRTKELVWCTLSENKNSKPSVVMWSGIQRSLEMANSDVLILLDCCSSGVANDSEGNGITELIGACPYDTKANGVGYYSFTQALVTELRLLSCKPCFSVGELYKLIYTRMQSHLPQGVKNERYPPPVHFVLTQDQHFDRGIKLSIQESRVPCPNPAEKSCQKRVRFEDPPDLEEPKGSPSSHGPNKRPCLSQDSGSRIESIVRPWIENTDTNLDPNFEPPLPNLFEHDNDSQIPTANQAQVDQDIKICTQKVLSCGKDNPRALFAVRFREDIRPEELSVDLFTEWFRSIPAAVEEVCVEAAFKCFSTLLLISVPLSMSSYISQHPAIFPLGTIISSITIPVKTGKKPCAGNKETNNEGVSIRGSSKSGEEGDSWEPLEQEIQSTAYKEYQDKTELCGTPIDLAEITRKNEITKINLERDTHQLEQKGPEFEVSGSARIYVRYILDKFPNADIKLAQRLGEANWQRHVKIRSGSQISKIQLEVAGAKSVFHDTSTVHDSSIFHDSGLGSSMASASCYAPSASSFVSKVGDDDNEYFKVPRTPTEVFEGKPFKCFICGHRLLGQIKNRVDWKLHVFADIKPYICIVSSCQDALCTFASRKEFAEHEKNCHSIHSQDQLTNYRHLDRMNPYGQDTSDQISAPEGNLSCPLCRKDLGASKRTYISHVAKHMESIALATLPPDPEDMSGDESGFSDQSDESVQNEEGHHSREPSPSLSLFQSKSENITTEGRNGLYNSNEAIETSILFDNSTKIIDYHRSASLSPVVFNDIEDWESQIMNRDITLSELLSSVDCVRKLE